MNKKKIIYFGSAVWELTSKHLKMLLDNEANIVAFVVADTSKISTTVTKKDPYENIADVSKRLNIPSYCPKNLMEPEFINFLKSFSADMFIICGLQFLMPKTILDIPHLGAINFHSSLLPRHSGMHPGFWTIWYGDQESGMVIHYMDSGLDTGDIIYQSKVPVLCGDTIATLYDRIWDSSEPLVKNLVEGLESDNLPRTPQDMNKYFYNYELSEKDFELDFRWPASVLYGRVIMRPDEFYFLYNNKKYFVRSCSVINEPDDTRKYLLDVPYLINNKVTFVTPDKFLQINDVIRDGCEMDPKSIID